MKAMQYGCNKVNAGVADVPQKQRQSPPPGIYLMKWHEFQQITLLSVF